MKIMKNSAFVGNTGHFDNEIDFTGSEGLESVKVDYMFTDSAHRLVSLQRQLLVVQVVQRAVEVAVKASWCFFRLLKVDGTGTHSSFQRQSGHSSCATENTTVL